MTDSLFGQSFEPRHAPGHRIRTRVVQRHILDGSVGTVLHAIAGDAVDPRPVYVVSFAYGTSDGAQGCYYETQVEAVPIVAELIGN